MLTNNDEQLIILDVSELESPLPLQVVLKAISENTLNKKIIVFHRLEPIGLFAQLEKLKLKYSCEKENQRYKISIWREYASKC